MGLRSALGLTTRTHRRGPGGASSTTAVAGKPGVATNISDLDTWIEKVDAAQKQSDDAMRSVLGQFSYELHYPDVDPFSQEYRNFVCEQYQQIAGKGYSTANERTPFDFASAVKRPFPYSTGSTSTTGDYLVALGHLLKNLNITPRGRIADMGPGWGVSTDIFARMGFDVTAIEIDPLFADLIQARTDQNPITLVRDDFLSLDKQGGLFDAVIFFECFHHCLDHVELLRACHRKTTPSGVVMFGGEPISERYSFPWGIRPDGMAVWSVRNFGWLELGFSQAYFLEALRKTGWTATMHPLGGYPNAFCYRATKI